MPFGPWPGFDVASNEEYFKDRAASLMGIDRRRLGWVSGFCWDRVSTAALTPLLVGGGVVTSLNDIFHPKRLSTGAVGAADLVGYQSANSAIDAALSAYDKFYCMSRVRPITFDANRRSTFCGFATIYPLVGICGFGYHATASAAKWSLFSTYSGGLNSTQTVANAADPGKDDPQIFEASWNGTTDPIVGHLNVSEERITLAAATNTPNNKAGPLFGHSDRLAGVAPAYLTDLYQWAWGFELNVP